jgi:hypothetical protein
MTVVVQIESSWPLNAWSMTRMKSLRYILLAHFVTNIAFALSLKSHMQKDSQRCGCLTVRFGCLNIHMVHSTLAHAQVNYHVSQFDY